MVMSKKKNNIFAPQSSEKMKKEKIKERAISEAQRYLDNAKTMLSEKAGKKGDFYTDVKYVKTACGTAYCGVLIIIDAYIAINGEVLKLPKYARKSIEYYQANLATRNTTMLNYLNAAYRVLHLNGYYEGETKYAIIQAGMNVLKELTEYFRDKC